MRYRSVGRGTKLRLEAFIVINENVVKKKWESLRGKHIGRNSYGECSLVLINGVLWCAYTDVQRYTMASLLGVCTDTGVIVVLAKVAYVRLFLRVS